MNPHAVKQADDQFYKMHPELVDPVTLQRRPLSMNPKDAKLRTEWMASYKAADDAEKNGFSTCEAGGILTPCPAKAPAPPPSPSPPPASCKVEVRANKLSPLGYYHMFIVFTDGGGKEYYLRGGPSPSAPVGSGASSSDITGGSSHAGSVGSSKSVGGSSNSSGSSGSSDSSHASGSNPSASSDSSRTGGGGPFGNIVAEYGEYLPGTIDWEPGAKATTVESGPSTCGRYAELKVQMDKITASKTRYNPIGPNSNSTVFTALNNIGITPAAPDDVWVPGSEMTIPTK